MQQENADLSFDTVWILNFRTEGKLLNSAKASIKRLINVTSEMPAGWFNYRNHSLPRSSPTDGTFVQEIAGGIAWKYTGFLALTEFQNAINGAEEDQPNEPITRPELGALAWSGQLEQRGVFTIMFCREMSFDFLRIQELDQWFQLARLSIAKPFNSKSFTVELPPRICRYVYDLARKYRRIQMSLSVYNQWALYFHDC